MTFIDYDYEEEQLNKEIDNRFFIGEEDFEEEIEFTRLKRLSTEYSNIGGVRD